MRLHASSLNVLALAAVLLAAGCAKDTTFAITGRVTGLRGTGLVLQTGLGPDLPVQADGLVTFTGAWKPGTPFTLGVGAQPTGPRQTCVVVDSHAEVQAADELFAVACTTDAYQVGGTVSGLSGHGLVLQDGGIDDLAVTGDGAFAFAGPVASGGAYAVTVKTQPVAPAQTCLVTGGAGEVVGGAVSSVEVNCTTDRFAVGGQVAGLAGGGLVLQDGGADDLAVNANGAFAFATTLASGGAYDVTVRSQPTAPAQTCAVEAGQGTVAGAAVQAPRVTCTTNAYAVGGTVTGLAGAGLTLRLAGGEDLAVARDGAFRFAGLVRAGQAYEVSIVGQPATPAQRCTASGAAGVVVAADVASVTVNCATQAFAVGGDVTGLDGQGLVLTQAGADDLPVASRGGFAFATPVASGRAYLVAVKAQPTGPWQTCAVASGSGTVGSAPVADVQVSCATNAYAVGGTVSGLAGGVVELVNGADVATVNGDLSFTLPPVRSGASYSVTVRANPVLASQTCTVANGTGVVAGAPVTDVAVSCATDEFTVGGTATGMPPAGLALRNGGETIVLGFDGPYAFTGPVPSGGSYDVQVVADPPTLACTVTGGQGVVLSGPVTSADVTCACAAGRADCDLDPGNGCEVDLLTDGASCGTCGAACGAGQVCVAGGCVAAGP